MGILNFFKKHKKRVKPVQQGKPVKGDFKFDIIDIKNIKDYYQETLKINEQRISIDLNFEKEAITQIELDQVYEFIEKIEGLNMINKEYIKRDFQQPVSNTADYLNFFLEELDETELGGIIDLSSATAKSILLMEQLKLNRVGIYPETEHFATFDYSIEIDGEPCNQLLVVNIHENGSLDYITWES